VKRKNAVVLAAHPDDETIGAGGFLHKLSNLGWLVEVVFITDGCQEYGRHRRREDRLEAAVEAMKVLGVTMHQFNPLKGGTLSDASIARVVPMMVPIVQGADLVLCPSSLDVQQEHRAAANIARIVTRPKEGVVAPALMEYVVDRGDWWAGTAWNPNYYVEIRDELETKVAALECYDMELEPYPAQRSPESIRLEAQFWGARTSMLQAEPYRIIRAYFDGAV
jgi:LmbE family N-acetylglucosaminyl deacetylase